MATTSPQVPSMNKNLVKIAVILAVATVAVYGLYLLRINKPVQQQRVEAFSVEKTDLQSDQLPQGFPENLPEEAGAKITQNYDATTNDGRVQSTRVMTTNKSLAVAVETYSDFFAGLGWKAITGNSDGSTTILMLKGDDSLLIVGSESNNERSVTLTLTEVE
jgi:hypothetical protein